MLKHSSRISRMSYMKPTTPTRPGTAKPRALLPLSNPKLIESPLKLAQRRAFVPGWVCSSHIIQAATPRESPAIESARTTLPTSPARELSKAERQAVVELEHARIVNRRAAIASGAKVIPDETIMWNAVNRYARSESSNRSPGVTLVVCHATGFHKEIWETTFRFLIAALENSPRAPCVTEIWAMDAVNHGDSAVLNEGKLGDVSEWSDHARDIVNFLVHYLPEPQVECDKVYLPPVPESIYRQRLDRGFTSRKLVGMGHSFGGCTLMRAALHLPRLFSGIILVDPVIFPSYGDRTQGISRLARGALARRGHWPDRKTAEALLLKSPFFQAYHPDVFSDYLTYGTSDCENGVKLKCSPHQEGVTFAELGRLPQEVWEMVPLLDERIPLRWMMESGAANTTAGEEITQHTVWRRPTNSSNVRIKGAGHLIPQEQPEKLANEILKFIQEQCERDVECKL